MTAQKCARLFESAQGGKRGRVVYGAYQGAPQWGTPQYGFEDLVEPPLAV